MSRIDKRCDWCGKHVDVNNSLGMLMVAGNKIYCCKKCQVEAESHEGASKSGCLIILVPFIGIFAFAAFYCF